jgi:hypothetical protein
VEHPFLGGVIKTHYTKSKHVYEEKYIGERLCQRVAPEEEREENNVATIAGDRPTWSYAREHFQSRSNFHETSVSSAEPAS